MAKNNKRKGKGGGNNGNQGNQNGPNQGTNNNNNNNNNFNNQNNQNRNNNKNNNNRNNNHQNNNRRNGFDNNQNNRGNGFNNNNNNRSNNSSNNRNRNNFNNFTNNFGFSKAGWYLTLRTVPPGIYGPVFPREQLDQMRRYVMSILDAVSNERYMKHSLGSAIVLFKQTQADLIYDCPFVALSGEYSGEAEAQELLRLRIQEQVRNYVAHVITEWAKWLSHGNAVSTPSANQFLDQNPGFLMDLPHLTIIGERRAWTGLDSDGDTIMIDRSLTNTYILSRREPSNGHPIVAFLAEY